MATIDLMDQFSHLGEGGIRNNGTLDDEVMFQHSLRTMRTDFIQVKAGDSIVYKNMNGMASSWNILSFYTGDAQGFYISGIAGQTTPQSGVWTAQQDGYVRLFGSFPAGDKISVTMTDLAPDVEDYLSKYNAMNYRFLPNSIPKIVAHIQEYLSNHPIADSTTLQAVIDAAFRSYLDEIQETADNYIAEAVPPAAAAAVDAAASPALQEITAKTAEAAESARQAGLSQQSAEMSEENALTYRNQAQQIKDSISAEVAASVLAAQEQATLAQESAQAADESADTAEQFVTQARAQAEAAADQAQTASGYASDAQGYMQDASGFAQNASDFADNAAQSAATFSTDPTLTIAGKAADAKATGDQLSDLKSAINAELNPINLTGWESGGYNTTNGTNYESPTYIRNQTFVSLAEGTERITCDSGYLMLLYAWKISDGSFVGSMKTSGVFNKTTANYALISAFDCVKFTDYKIKVTMRIDPASESITSADGEHCYFHHITDKTLTKENKAADAKVTGEAKTAIDDLVKPTISWIDNYHINSSGTLSSNSSYHWTGLIDIGNTGNRMYYRQLAFSNLGINIYDANNNVIATLVPSQSSTPVYVEGIIDLSQYPNARYIAFGASKVSEFDLRLAEGYKKTLSIPDNTVSTAMIQDKSITIKKTEFAVHDPETNFIDKSSVIIGKIINQSGAVSNANGWCCTDYLELTPGKTYYISDYVYRKYWGFYNASKEVVGCYNDNGDLIGSFTFPSGAKYARFSFQTAEEYFNGAYVSINSGKPADYGYILEIEKEYPTDYEGMDVSTFNKLLCIGDSLTYGYFNRNSGATADYAEMATKYSYPTQFKKITGVDTTNKGDSGKTTAEWYSLHGNEDLSGHDACIIELGTNDGTWSATSETALSNIIAKVKADNKGIKIFVSTIPNGQSYVSSAYKAINAGIRAYVAGLSDVDVCFIDLEAYGHMIQSAGYNAGHLSAYGYWRLAKDYANYISYIMNNKKDAFRLVQFTGTNDTYTP